MKKVLLLLLALSIPCLIILAVWQAYSFQQLETEVAGLEAKQKEWFEENKRKIIGIEYLSSPRRLDRIAKDELKLGKLDPRKIIRIVVPENREEVDG